MGNSFKTDREQRLAIELFAQRIKILDQQFSDFLNSAKLLSLNDLIEIRTQPLDEEFTFTEMIFNNSVKSPYEIKTALITEFSGVFRE